MRETIEILQYKFPSVTSLKQYVRDSLSNIDVCESLSTANNEYYKFFCELMKRHPEYAAKTSRMKDLKIIRNALNPSAFELNIVNNDNTVTPISWVVCCNAKNKNISTMFHEALRECITNQILEFRNNNNNVCQQCGIMSNDYHIDHELDFKKIVLDFMAKYKFEIPKEYDRKKITNQIRFRVEDFHIKDLFEVYHQERAKLRVLCKRCNLGRPKYKEYVIEFD